jgi:putative ABC transport system substrate-binding protein
MPVVGLLPPASAAASVKPWVGLIAMFHEGLKEQGYVEGQNVAIEYRWADGHADRLPALAADLVRKQVAVIATISQEPAFAAKAATTTIPIVFTVSMDPVKFGFVANLARPGGNMTGINLYTAELSTKRLELLRDLVPTATRVAVLVDPSSPENTESTVSAAQTAANSLGLQINVLNASTASEIDAAFARVVRERIDAVFVDFDTLFTTQLAQLVDLASHYAVPAIYGARQFAEAGGLMSYGTSLADAWRQVGVYTGRLLKGEKPTDMPVIQPTKFDFVVNLKTAKALGLTVPQTLLVAADEVIE